MVRNASPFLLLAQTIKTKNPLYRTILFIASCMDLEFFQAEAECWFQGVICFGREEGGGGGSKAYFWSFFTWNSINLNRTLLWIRARSKYLNGQQ